jgi:soluble lytic murein transglycosylase-like protein
MPLSRTRVTAFSLALLVTLALGCASAPVRAPVTLVDDDDLVPGTGESLEPGALALLSGTASPASGTGTLRDDDVGDDDVFPDVNIDDLLPGLRASRPGAAQAQGRVASASVIAVAQRRAKPPGAGLSAPLSSRERERREARIREHVARRMRGIPEQESRRVSEVILEAAAWARLDPVLILAIIEVESAFDLSARSNRDARGLMQVRPATLRGEAERAGLVGDDPHEPGLNVRAGSLYFRRLVDAFGMNDVALMAYNAGPNRILGHIRAGGIPERYFEYPRRVRAAEARLRALLAAEPPPALAARETAGRSQRQD